MKKILLQFKDGDFLVSPETADRVQQVVPPNRYVTTTTIETPDATPPSRLAGPSQSKSVFERAQPPSNLSPKQRQLAERFARHLTPPPKQSK